jgi:hypothetical protein
VKNILVKRNLFESRLKFVRWVVLLSVLTGLFFSGGEGIRLLPFPKSSETEAKSSSRVLTANSDSFNFSIHHSGGYSLKIKSQIQKNLKRILAASNVSSADLNITEVFRFTPQKDHQIVFFSYDSFLLSSISGRAPPRI